MIHRTHAAVLVPPPLTEPPLTLESVSALAPIPHSPEPALELALATRRLARSTTPAHAQALVVPQQSDAAPLHAVAECEGVMAQLAFVFVVVPASASASALEPLQPLLAA